MLVIRMQRTGRKGHAQFRVVVQDSRRTPTSGKVVAQIGTYNPHSKEAIIDKEKAQFYVGHGAQPTERVARLLKAEGVKLPSWVALPEKKVRKTKNADKLRKNQPPAPVAEPVEEEFPDTVEATKEPIEEAEPATSEEPDEEAPTEPVEETPEVPTAK